MKSNLIDRSDAFWWGHDPLSGDAGALRDYVIGTTVGIASNLQQAAVALSLATRTRTAHDFAMGEYVRTSGRPYPTVTDHRFVERGIEISVYTTAFFTMLGAAFDCLAATAVGVAAIPTDVRTADLQKVFQRPFEDAWSLQPTIARRLSPPTEEWGAAQRAMLDGLRVSLREAGPRGWLDWVINMRNTLVHREHRTNLIAANSKGRARGFAHLPPRRPETSNIESLRSADEDLYEVYLSEDLLTTMAGVAESTAAGMVAALAVANQTWTERLRIRPRSDWSTQWKPPSLRDGGFDGYLPNSAKLAKKGFVVLNPESVRRLRQAGVITDY